MGTIDREADYQKGMGHLDNTIEALEFGVGWVSHISNERAEEIMSQLKQIQSDLSY